MKVKFKKLGKNLKEEMKNIGKKLKDWKKKEKDLVEDRILGYYICY